MCQYILLVSYFLFAKDTEIGRKLIIAERGNDGRWRLCSYQKQIPDAGCRIMDSLMVDG